MIGGILGGTTAMRMGESARIARLNSLDGKQTVVVSCAPKIYPLTGIMPKILAPGEKRNMPVDVLAECFGAANGVDETERLFVESVLSRESDGAHRSSNDIYWFENMRRNLGALFRAAGIISVKRGRQRSIISTFCQCFHELSQSVGDAELNSRPKNPEWMADLPEREQNIFKLAFLKPASPNSTSHLTTLMPTIAELEAFSPAEWVRPQLSSPDAGPLFIYAPAWESTPYRVLLKMLAKRRAFLLLSELHQWDGERIRQTGYILKNDSRLSDWLWTSLSVPHDPYFEPEWEIYGKSGGPDIERLFRGRLNNLGMEGDTRLKNLQFETPASLDDFHALVRNSRGWSVQDVYPFNEAQYSKLEFDDCELSGVDLFEKNMAQLEEREQIEIFGGFEDPPFEEIEDEDNLTDGARLIIGRPQFEEGDLYSINGEKILNDAPLKFQTHFALLKNNSTEPQTPLALYEAVWEASEQREIQKPRVEGFLPVTVENVPASGDTYADCYAPSFVNGVRLLLAGFKGGLKKGSYTAFGTWLEPRKTFLVRALLRQLTTPTDSVKNYALIPSYEGRWKEVCEETAKLKACLKECLNKRKEAPGAEPLSPDLAERLSQLMHSSGEAARSAMDSLHYRGTLNKKLERRGFIGMDLNETDKTFERFNEVFPAVDSSGWFPCDYRERLKSMEKGRELVDGADRIFASLLLNLDTSWLP